MSRMKPIARHILLMMIIGLATYARLQHASAQSGVINDDRQRFSIAVPDFSDSSASDGASWSTMAQAIASDLRASGRFTLIESNMPTEGRADAFPHFDRWRGTDAKWLVIGRVIRVVLTVRGSLPVYPNNRTSSERFSCRKSANSGPWPVAGKQTFR